MGNVYENLMRNLNDYMSKDELEFVSKAFNRASELHAGQRRQSGENYIVHPLSVAFILSEMKADVDTICAALLHDTLEDTPMTKEKIAFEFNDKVATLVDGVTKIGKMHFSSKQEQNATNTKKIITSLDTDVRIVIIKLADRLHNMRTLEYKSEFKQKENSLETMGIFVPLSFYLGMYQMKSELEDLSLYYLKRDVFERIENYLAVLKDETDMVFKKMLEDIGNILTDNNIDFEYKTRVKSIYGLYKEVIKGKNIKDVHDLLAIKIMTGDVKDCYHVMGLIHSEYPPVNSMFKDYIASPKTNKYSSLHTTVFGLNDYLVQMQIRTGMMDIVDTYGIASYWNLKGPAASEVIQDDVINNFQFFSSLSELESMTTDNSEFVDLVKKELFDKSIYVYTTNGDVIELPAGSTPIDFAYKISEDVGNTLIGAVINDRRVDLDYKLQNNDIIKLINDPFSYGPRLEWQNKVKTVKAKKMIREFSRRKRIH